MPTLGLMHNLKGKQSKKDKQILKCITGISCPDSGGGLRVEPVVEATSQWRSAARTFWGLVTTICNNTITCANAHTL